MQTSKTTPPQSRRFAIALLTILVAIGTIIGFVGGFSLSGTRPPASIGYASRVNVTWLFNNTGLAYDSTAMSIICEYFYNATVYNGALVAVNVTLNVLVWPTRTNVSYDRPFTIRDIPSLRSRSAIFVFVDAVRDYPTPGSAKDCHAVIVTLRDYTVTPA